MSLIDEIQAALSALADEAWSQSAHEDGYARFPLQSGLRTALDGFQDRMFDEFEDEWGFPWGLEDYNLISMIWDASGPGLGSTWTIRVLRLLSGRCIYIQFDDYGDQPLILAVSAQNWSPRIDRKFLQGLFKDNGDSFGTCVFGSPPNSVRTSVKSFPFLVDLFVAGFDAAPEECWEALLEDWNVWEEEYENPEDPIEIPSDLLREALDADIREHGNPRSLATGHAHERRTREAAYRKMMDDEIDDFLGEVRFRLRSPVEPEAKVQIVARYLCHALSDPGLG